jgi:lipopolysaccharide biosynthesis glycosyltransferase
MIPEKAGWTGRAIYLDADQLVFGDIQELFDYPDRDKPATACPAWMTFQPSKFSRKPHPHSSVMVIDCEEAKRHQFFHIDSVVTYLKSHTDKKSYASLMFPDWCNPRMLPTVWNSLNVYQKGQTKLLHYTKEPEQPWYVPAHPLAKHWRAALQEAVRAGVVTSDEIRAAVSQFGVKQDWRSTNGLHPDYLRVLQTK